MLDVACGQGLATRVLAAAGAHRVVGTDLSDAMIAIALRHRDPAGASDISYVVDDAQQLQAFDDNAFDGLACQLGLMNIPELHAAPKAMHRVLRPHGWLVFVIGHPCFLVPDADITTNVGERPAVSVTGYFEERFWRSSNLNGVRRAGNHHRTLSNYLNGLIRAAFFLDAVDEPRPSDLLTKQQPLYSEVPIFFGCRAIRNTSQTPSVGASTMSGAASASGSPCGAPHGACRSSTRT